MRHSDRPQRRAGRDEGAIKTKIADILASPYVASVRPLDAKVRGKTIRTSQAGRAGYILYFSDGTFLLAYLADSELRWKAGPGEPSPADALLIHSPVLPDVSGPQRADRPYAAEKNDIAAEVAKARGQMVKGIAYGEDTFNLVFPDGHEMDAALIPSADGRKGLRVFWEQW